MSYESKIASAGGGTVDPNWCPCEGNCIVSCKNQCGGISCKGSCNLGCSSTCTTMCSHSCGGGLKLG